MDNSYYDIEVSNSAKISITDPNKEYHNGEQYIDLAEPKTTLQDEPDIDSSSNLENRASLQHNTSEWSSRWEITGVLDWDDVLSVPLVLARKPPAWLWFDEEDRSSWDGNNDVDVNRDLTHDELLIKAHLDRIMSRASPTYTEDTYWPDRG